MPSRHITHAGVTGLKSNRSLDETAEDRYDHFSASSARRISVAGPVGQKAAPDHAGFPWVEATGAWCARRAGDCSRTVGSGGGVVEPVQGLAQQRLAHDLFEGAHHVAVVRGDQGKGVAGAFGAPGAADAVDVGVGGIGHVEVDHVRDAFHVQAAGGDVGGDHDLVMAALETGQCRLALALGAVAVQAGDAVAGAVDLLGQAGRGGGCG